MFVKSTHGQHGSTEAVVIAVLVVALVGALGWIFWQNFVDKYDAPPAGTQVANKDKDTVKKDDAKSALRYVDFRVDGKDVTGLILAAPEDVAKLDGASQKLKDFFVADMRKSFPVYDFTTGESATQETKLFTVDRVYGDYAVGSYDGSAAYMAWGPKNATGGIESVAGTQDQGFRCDELRTAKVPAELVDGRCLAPDSDEYLRLVEYAL